MKKIIIILCLVVFNLTFNVKSINAQLRSVSSPDKDRISASFDTAAMKATAQISNKGGVRIAADFYAASEIENAAISPPSMVSTYAALTYVSAGKTQEELQKLLFLSGDEQPHFEMLGRYLQKKCSESKSDFGPGNYTWCGNLFARIGSADLNRDQQSELLEKFGTTFKLTDFSEGDVKKINEQVKQISDFDNIIKLNPDTVFAVCSAMNYEECWTWRMRGDAVLPFNFDKGRKNIVFLKGNMKGYQDVTVNNKSGYLFPLGVSDLIIVQCKNGTTLKQFAKTIAGNGLNIQPGRKISRQTKLQIPITHFQTEFNFLEYAAAKGYSTPFSENADYTIAADKVNGRPMYCNQAEIKSDFVMDERGITLKQVTYASFADDLGRDQRLRNNITIDSPYMVMLVEQTTGTVMGIAFIASPTDEEVERSNRSLTQ